MQRAVALEADTGGADCSAVRTTEQPVLRDSPAASRSRQSTGRAGAKGARAPRALQTCHLIPLHCMLYTWACGAHVAGARVDHAPVDELPAELSHRDSVECQACGVQTLGAHVGPCPPTDSRRAWLMPNPKPNPRHVTRQVLEARVGPLPTMVLHRGWLMPDPKPNPRHPARQVLEARVDHARVVDLLRKADHLPLVKEYLLAVQKTNLGAVNEAVRARPAGAYKGACVVQSVDIPFHGADQKRVVCTFLWCFRQRAKAVACVSASYVRHPALQSVL